MARLPQIYGENFPFSQKEFAKLRPFFGGRVAISMSTGYSFDDPE
jgi:hypothetical protein